MLLLARRRLYRAGGERAHTALFFRERWTRQCCTGETAAIACHPLAVDFFDYFTAVEPLLDADPTLLAASAWADTGQPQFVDDPAAVLRSDFFPGLGWMLTGHVS